MSALSFPGKRLATIVAAGFLLAQTPAAVSGGLLLHRQGGAVPAIALAGRVTDAAALLTPDEQERIGALLQAFEQETGHQPVVVTVPSLGGRSVEAYSLALANSWGIGRKGHDDGVMLLVAPNERRLRIEVGRGLERQLPDRLCEQIIRQHILPRFRQAAYAAGIQSGVEALIANLSRPRQKAGA